MLSKNPYKEEEGQDCRGPYTNDSSQLRRMTVVKLSIVERKYSYVNTLKIIGGKVCSVIKCVAE